MLVCVCPTGDKKTTYKQIYIATKTVHYTLVFKTVPICLNVPRPF